MSKRNQYNRRKSYGRRQHELYERRQRDTRQPIEAGTDDLAAAGIADRFAFLDPRTPRLHYARATDDGRLPGYTAPHHRPAAAPPRVELQAPTLTRRRTRAAVRARRGPSRICILLAAIVVVFAGAFFSLSQDIRVSATGYEVDRLSTQHAASTTASRTSATS